MRALGIHDAEGFVETGAVYGFLDQVLSLVNRNKRADVIVCWEGSREGRRAIMGDYKAHRDDPDDEMKERLESIKAQQKLLRAILNKTKWGQARAAGWEADDAIATLARSGHRAGANVLILSNDADLFQCLRDGEDGTGDVHQWKTTKNDEPTWTVERLFNEKGVTPDQWYQAKALGGDTSDGYKGFPGIGEVWACKLIAKYKTFDGVVKAANDGDFPKAKAKSIVENEVYGRQCLDVAKTRDRVKLKIKWGSADKEAIINTFAALRFHSINTNNVLRRIT
jgi:5'-3' exonuclease